MNWPVKKVSLFDRTLPEARWNCSKFVAPVPIKVKRDWAIKPAKLGE